MIELLFVSAAFVLSLWYVWRYYTRRLRPTKRTHAGATEGRDRGCPPGCSGCPPDR